MRLINTHTRHTSEYWANILEILTEIICAALYESYEWPMTVPKAKSFIENSVNSFKSIWLQSVCKSQCFYHKQRNKHVRLFLSTAIVCIIKPKLIIASSSLSSSKYKPVALAGFTLYRESFLFFCHRFAHGVAIAMYILRRSIRNCTLLDRELALHSNWFNHFYTLMKIDDAYPILRRHAVLIMQKCKSTYLWNRNRFCIAIFMFI